MNKTDFYNTLGYLNPPEIEHFRQVLCGHDTDKAAAHSYHEIYGVLFRDPLTVRNVMEIGIWKGNSLRAWRELFPAAGILGLEYNPELLFAQDQISTQLFDQTKLDSFRSYKATNPLMRFDLIVDDALHHYAYTVLTMVEFSQILSPGGWLVIEDIRPEDVPVWTQWIESTKRGGTFKYAHLELVDLTADRPGMVDNHVVVYQRPM